MQPTLSLQYNSQGGNGLLGMGWSLGGLSGISRCPKIQATDGERGSVNFDANDRFCLDGQRLIVVSGNYGADGAEYRTEQESFSRVISYGTAGSGPASFKVWTKSGQLMEYGVTSDARIEAHWFYNDYSGRVRLMDMDGDGKSDIVATGTGGTYVCTSNRQTSNLLNLVTNGLGITTSITYKPLTDNSVYTKDNGSTYPTVDIQAPIYVVSSSTTSDGVGGNYQMNYRYGGMRASQDGRGTLGFRTVTATDPQTGNHKWGQTP